MSLVSVTLGQWRCVESEVWPNITKDIAIPLCYTGSPYNVCTCIYLFMHVCMYVCMSVYVCMYVCMYVCVCMHVTW